MADAVKAITFWSDLYLKYKVAPEGTPNFTTTRDIQPLFEANKVGLLAASSRKASLARAREILAVAAPARPAEPIAPPDPLPPCPCCAGRMRIIETFERWMPPRGPPRSAKPTGTVAA